MVRGPGGEDLRGQRGQRPGPRCAETRGAERSAESPAVRAHPAAGAARRAGALHAALRLCARALAALLLCAGTAAAALPEGAAVDLAREAWVPALLGQDGAARFRALDEMRADPDLARQALLLAVTDPAGAKERGRLIRHLAEFGRPEDLAPLLGRLERPGSAAERRATLGAVRALYPHYEPAADLAPVVAEFILLQTRLPQPYDAARENQWLLSARALEEYQRAAVPLDVIRAVAPLRDRPYPDRAALLGALQKLLAPADWRAWQEALAAPLAPLPPRLLIEGLLRVSLSQRGERPVLVQIGFDVWRAAFESEPPIGFVYVQPGEDARYEVPVRLIAPLAEAPVRIDLRLREVHHAPQPLYRKLLIPTMILPR